MLWKARLNAKYMYNAQLFEKAIELSEEHLSALNWCLYAFCLNLSDDEALLSKKYIIF